MIVLHDLFFVKSALNLIAMSSSSTSVDERLSNSAEEGYDQEIVLTNLERILRRESSLISSSRNTGNPYRLRELNKRVKKNILFT